MAFSFLYMTLANNKLNGRGLNNTAYYQRLPKSNVVLATEGLPGSTNKSDHFNFKGEWANT